MTTMPNGRVASVDAMARCCRQTTGAKNLAGASGWDWGGSNRWSRWTARCSNCSNRECQLDSSLIRWFWSGRWCGNWQAR